MTRYTLLTLAFFGFFATAAESATFVPAPLLPNAGVDVLDRSVTRERVGRDLFGNPWATAVIGHVDVYDRFPYLESRWFQVVSDAAWNRLLVGEIEGRLGAWDGATSSFGRMDAPRGVDVDAFDRLYVADSGNRRVLVFDVVTEYDRVDLVPRFAIQGLARPYDVAHSDAGTPFDASDDRLYVADAGSSRVLAYDVDATSATLRASLGELGRGAGRFAGPMAIAVGRADGVCTSDVYVADSHNHRVVRLRDRGDAFEWRAEAVLDGEGITSLDTDHFGHVYATSPEAGVTKLTAVLAPLARMTGDIARPRCFHVPFVTRTDHRSGETRRVGHGGALLLEEWSDRSGVRLVRLGVDVTDARVRSDHGLAAGFVLTDRAAVRAEVVDAAGAIVARSDLGTRDAGAHDVDLSADLALAAGDYTLRVSASSTYENASGGSAEVPFTWNGPDAGPRTASVIGASPNPFGKTTSIRFSVPGAGVSTHSLAIYDLAGRLVRPLSSGARTPGAHAVAWDGRDSAGHVVAAGIYLARLEVAGEISVRKVVYLR